jgi:predicted cupin superfamily sugar epimerase
MTDAERWIKALALVRHPEGGWFRETYRSTEGISRKSLPARFPGDRSFSTAIYFLLAGEDFSAFHRIRQDEVWHFYDGSPLTVHVLDEAGRYAALKLGRNLERGETPQGVVRAGCWFAAAQDDAAGYALVGCTVAPGFDFADFEMPAREQLLALYPQHRALIERLTS